MSAPARRAPPSLSLALASVGVLLGALSWWAPPLKRPAPSPEERLSDAWRARLTPLALSKPTPLSAPPLRELSGLVESARHPGVFWAHNDSLDAPRLFALTSQGALITERRVLGARNVDWEDITVARDHPQGLLFVADSGDNFHWREERSVYVVREPASLEGDAPLSVVARLPYVFPQYPQSPQERGVRPPLALKERCRDSEALFWAEDGLYLIGKCFWGGRAPLYQLPLSPKTLAHLREPPLSSSRAPFTAPPQPLKLLQSLELGPSTPPNLWRVTAADFHPQRRELAVLTYGGLWRFKWRSPQASPEHKGERVARAGRGWRFEGGARAKQCEALAWRHEAREAQLSSPARLLMTNEQRELFELSLEP
jgi:hypothetical protein